MTESLELTIDQMKTDLQRKGSVGDIDFGEKSYGIIQGERIKKGTLLSSKKGKLLTILAYHPNKQFSSSEIYKLTNISPFDISIAASGLKKHIEPSTKYSFEFSNLSTKSGYAVLKEKDQE